MDQPTVGGISIAAPIVHLGENILNMEEVQFGIVLINQLRKRSNYV